MSDRSKANIKKLNQNFFDFILTNYGSLNYLSTYFSQNTIQMNDFDSYTNNKFNIIAENNYILSQYNKLNQIVMTDDKLNRTIGDFNDDWQDDYFI